MRDIFLVVVVSNKCFRFHGFCWAVPVDTCRAKRCRAIIRPCFWGREDLDADRGRLGPGNILDSKLSCGDIVLEMSDRRVG